MKKKVLTAALAVALIAIMVSGSLAYFTAEDQVTNTFTIGSVEIEIHENGALVEGDTLQMSDTLLPVVGSNPEAQKDNYGQKQVTVANTGKNAAYVQVFVAIPKQLDDAGVLKIMKNYPDSEAYHWAGGDAVVGTMTQEGITYNIYRYRYSQLLPAGTDNVTDSEAIEYVYLTSATDLSVKRDTDGNITAAYLVDANGVELTSVDVTKNLLVYVTAQAIQADGFDNYADALDAGFADTHPWQ